MRALVYHEYGPPENLELTEVDAPVPKDDEVLVTIHAVALNSWDWDRLRGSALVRPWGLWKPEYRILGCDIAGRVSEVGKDVTRLQVGDEVFGDISSGDWGGFAEQACAREDMLALKPEGMTFEQAAAVPQAAVLALQGLLHRGPIRAGQKILLNGAGGGVGTFAVQIAKSYGAEVTAVDRAAKLDLLRSIGADHVIDYENEDCAANGVAYDLILDVVGQRSALDWRRALGPEGVYVMVGGSAFRLFHLLLVVAPWTSTTSRKRMGILAHKPNIEDLAVLNDLFEAGEVVPVIDRCCALADVPEALRELGEGRVTGKVVVTLSPPTKAARPRTGTMMSGASTTGAEL